MAAFGGSLIGLTASIPVFFLKKNKLFLDFRICL